MIADLVDLLVGVAGTAAYLTAWNALRRQAAGVADPTRARRRQRWVQTLFFVLMTPYLLFLFWLMERLGGWLRGPAL